MKTNNIYTEDQIRRVLIGSGVNIETEFGNDFIIFCPYHNNSRTPAGEVAKDSGLFFCFGCQTTSFGPAPDSATSTRATRSTRSGSA